MAAIGLGSIIGARVVSRMSGGAIRAIMGVAMIASMGALILKMIVSAGAVGTAMDLSAWKLFIALPLMFGFGVINMFGVPMKPPAIALLLLLGMEPMAVLTVVMVMGVVSPMTGGVRVLRSGNYQRKPVLAGRWRALPARWRERCSPCPSTPRCSTEFCFLSWRSPPFPCCVPSGARPGRRKRHRIKRRRSMNRISKENYYLDIAETVLKRPPACAGATAPSL